VSPQILGCRHKQLFTVTHQADSAITAPAKKSPNALRLMTMVNALVRVATPLSRLITHHLRPTNPAPTSLLSPHIVQFVNSEAIHSGAYLLFVDRVCAPFRRMFLNILPHAVFVCVPPSFSLATRFLHALPITPPCVRVVLLARLTSVCPRLSLFPREVFSPPLPFVLRAAHRLHRHRSLSP